jgi:signal transduction histidine kinase
MSDQEPDGKSTATRSPRFVSALVHELRSPLSTLLMLGDLLAENQAGHLDEQEQRWADNLRAAAIDLRELLEQVGRLARIEGGRMAVGCAPVAVAELVGELREQLETRAREQGTTLRWMLDPLTPARCATDAALLRELLSTLLEAALAADPGGTVELAVAPASGGDTGAPSLAEQIVFRIADRGPTVPAEAAPELLAPFGRSDPRSRRRHGGAGLGLALARSIAGRLGGELVAEAGERGVAFVLRLPVDEPTR